MDKVFSVGPITSFHLRIGLAAITLNGSLEILSQVSNGCILAVKSLISLLGITVGCVVVPQSMAYAQLAELAPQFGLYSSFMGVLIYWFFATSKDITIGVSC